MSDELDSLLTRAKNQGGDDEETQDTDDTEQEYENYPAIQVSPTTAVSGEVVDLYYTGDISEEQQGQYGNDFVVTVKNPSVDIGSLFVNEDREEIGGDLARDSDDDSVSYSDYYIADPDGKSHTIRDGVLLTDKSAFVEVDDFEEDTVDFFIGGSSSNRLVGEILDVNGEPSAHAYNEEFTDGLIEYPQGFGSGDTDKSPRAARTPFLRDDIEGERVKFFLTWRSLVDDSFDPENGHDSYNLTVLLDDADSIEEATELTSVENREGVPDDAYRNMTWHDRDVSVTVSDDSVESGGDGFSDDEVEVIEGTVAYAEEEGFGLDDLNVIGHVEDNLDTDDEERIARVSSEIEERMS